MITRTVNSPLAAGRLHSDPSQDVCSRNKAVRNGRLHGGTPPDGLGQQLSDGAHGVEVDLLVDKCASDTARSCEHVFSGRVLNSHNQ